MRENWADECALSENPSPTTLASRIFELLGPKKGKFWECKSFVGVTGKLGF